MFAPANTRRFESCFLHRLHHFILIHVTVRFDPFEAGIFQNAAFSSTLPLRPTVPHMIAFLICRLWPVSAAGNANGLAAASAAALPVTFKKFRRVREEFINPLSFGFV